jgi:hypothetical protein
VDIIIIIHHHPSSSSLSSSRHPERCQITSQKGVTLQVAAQTSRI